MAVKNIERKKRSTETETAMNRLHSLTSMIHNGKVDLYDANACEQNAYTTRVSLGLCEKCIRYKPDTKICALKGKPNDTI